MDAYQKHLEEFKLMQGECQFGFINIFEKFAPFSPTFG